MKSSRAESRGPGQECAGDPAQRYGQTPSPNQESPCQAINTFKAENQELTALSAEMRNEQASKSLTWECERQHLLDGKVIGLATAKRDMDILVEAMEESAARERACEAKIKDMASTLQAKDELIVQSKEGLQRQEAETQRVEAQVQQSHTMWQATVSALEESMTAQHEASVKKMEELQQRLTEMNEKLFSKQQASIAKVTRMEEEVELLVQKNKELQELALMSDKDKARMKKEEEKSKKEAEKRLKKERREKEEREKKERTEREKEEKRARKEIRKREKEE